MEPTFHDGDVLVVLHGARPRPGRPVVVRLPDGPDGPRPLAVKRVTGPAPGEPGAWWVERDNPREGVDSWLVGAIPDDDVVALVLGRVPAWLTNRTLGRVAARRGRR